MNIEPYYYVNIIRNDSDFKNYWIPVVRFQGYDEASAFYQFMRSFDYKDLAVISTMTHAELFDDGAIEKHTATRIVRYEGGKIEYEVKIGDRVRIREPKSDIKNNLFKVVEISMLLNNVDDSDGYVMIANKDRVLCVNPRDIEKIDDGM